MSNDYIFCPLCAGSEWITDKTRRYHDEIFIHNRCIDCKNFAYAGTNTKLLEVEAIMQPYKVIIDHEYDFTIITAMDGTTILHIKQVINFNWYKYEETLDKIKKYVVFS
jgi:hypothetical protein